MLCSKRKKKVKFSVIFNSEINSVEDWIVE